MAGDKKTHSADVKAKNGKVDKVVNNKNQSSKLFRKFGFVFVLFFIFSALYFSWLYIAPFIFESKISDEDVVDFIKSKFNFKAEYSLLSCKTTPSVSLDVILKDFRLSYPEGDGSDAVFLKSKSLEVEVPLIPLMMKTIKFNKFILRGVYVSTFQDSEGKYVYQEYIKNNFNPAMPQYVLEVPSIKLIAYTFDNYNQQTDTYKKDGGNSLIIKPIESKLVLQKSPNASTIILK